MKEGRKPETWRQLPTSFRKCHNLKQDRDSNPHFNICGRLGKQTNKL